MGLIIKYFSALPFGKIQLAQHSPLPFSLAKLFNLIIPNIGLFALVRDGCYNKLFSLIP